MIVKKFQAPTEREAIIKAQEELGSTAVVLNVKTIKQRGFAKLFKKDAVEVTAALEEKDFVDGINKSRPSFDNTMNKEQMINRSMVSTGSLPSINLVADDSVNLSSSSTASAIEQKLDSLHDLLQNQSFNKPADVQGTVSNPYSGVAGSVRSLYNDDTDIKSASSDNTERQQVKQRENANYKSLQLIYKKLIDNEVDSRYADEIIGEIENSLKKESNIDSILSAVYQKIILKLGKPRTITLSDKAKVVFFIGPTGVVVYSVEDMDKSLTDYKDYDLILIDTAGRSHKADDQMDELKSFIEQVVQRKDEFDFESYLTLSVTTKYKDLKSIADKYDDVDWSIIFTKLDETCSLGNILNLRMLTDRPLAYTTSGQNVPNDIEVINEQWIAKQLLGGGE